MILFSEHIALGTSKASGGSINTVVISGNGSHYSEEIPASVGDYISFGFTSTTGFTFSCDPDVSLGTGVFEQKSDGLFPITGDDQPKVIDILVKSTFEGKFQLVIEATTI